MTQRGQALLCHKYVYTHYSRETSLNQICDKLESKSAKAQIKIETSLNQNPRRLESKLRQAWNFFAKGSKKNYWAFADFFLSLCRSFFEPLPIFFWAFADFVLGLREFCFGPVWEMFQAARILLPSRIRFMLTACLSPCDLYSGIIRKYVWIGV